MKLIGKRLADAGAAYGLDLHRYVVQAHSYYKPEFMYTWFAICFYRCITPERDLKAVKTVGRMLYYSLPEDALVPAEFLLPLLSRSPKFARVIDTCAKLFSSRVSFDQGQETLSLHLNAIYHEQAADAVRQRLLPLDKYLLYCGTTKVGPGDNYLFKDAKLEVADLLREQFNVVGSPLVLWSYLRKYDQSLQDSIYFFYDASGAAVDIQATLEVVYLQNLEASPQLQARILNAVRRVRLRMLTQ